MNRTTMTLDSLVARNEDMVAGVVDADVMVMSIETGKYFQLNAMGGEIFDILREPLRASALCDVLESRFSVARDTLEKEIVQYLGELAARNIITIA